VKLLCAHPTTFVNCDPLWRRIRFSTPRRQQPVGMTPAELARTRRRLAERMCRVINPAVWVVDDTGYPKDGRHSVGVQRQSCGTLGKVANCQLGVSVHAASEQASCPLDWRLFL
jgi:SRSO17 transposase